MEKNSCLNCKHLDGWSEFGNEYSDCKLASKDLNSSMLLVDYEEKWGWLDDHPEYWQYDLITEKAGEAIGSICPYYERGADFDVNEIPEQRISEDEDSW